ncbi:MAG: nitroreductase family protein [Planifilum fimeticola]
MDVLTAIEKRREITRFKTDPIPDRLMDALLQSLYLAPSGNNLPSREFIVVKDREMLRPRPLPT